MDNFHFDITAEVKEVFDLAFKIAFLEHGPAKFYAKDHDHGFVLLWAEEHDAHPLPVFMASQAAADMVWSWLKTEVTYERDEAAGYIHDSDVDNEEGFRVYNESWGHVGKWHYAILAVKPAWMWYGK